MFRPDAAVDTSTGVDKLSMTAKNLQKVDDEYAFLERFTAVSCCPTLLTGDVGAVASTASGKIG